MILPKPTPSPPSPSPQAEPPAPAPMKLGRALRPLLMLLLFFAIWSERNAMQGIADATSTSLVRLAMACGDPNR